MVRKGVSGRLCGWRIAIRYGAEAKPMLIVHVHVHVKPESVADFTIRLNYPP